MGFFEDFSYSNKKIFITFLLKISKLTIKNCQGRLPNFFIYISRNTTFLVSLNIKFINLHCKWKNTWKFRSSSCIYFKYHFLYLSNALLKKLNKINDVNIISFFFFSIIIDVNLNIYMYIYLHSKMSFEFSQQETNFKVIIKNCYCNMFTKRNL